MTREPSSDRASQTLTAKASGTEQTTPLRPLEAAHYSDLPRREDRPDGVRVILGSAPAPASATGSGENCVDQPQRRVRPL